MHLYLSVPLMVDPLWEIQFWFDIQGAHTLLLEERLPDLENRFKGELEKIRGTLTMEKDKAAALYREFMNQPYWPEARLINEFKEILYEAGKVSRQLVKILETILQESTSIVGERQKMTLSHMLRESEYFLRILRVIKYSR